MTTTFKIGDHVTVTHRKENDYISWIDGEMDKGIGKEGIIIKPFPDLHSFHCLTQPHGYEVHFDHINTNWIYPIECLKPFGEKIMAEIGFKIGDKVLVKMKKNVHGIGWDDRQMDKAVGKTGIVTDYYLINNKVVGYRVSIEGISSNYIYPTECLEPIFPLDLEKGEKVIIWQKPEDELLLKDYNWIDDMDFYIGKEGTVNHILDDGSVNVFFNDNMEFYFPPEAVCRPHSLNEVKAFKYKWVLGRISGKPYKAIEENESGYYLLEDEDGTISSSQFMQIEIAPVDCEDFSYRKNKKVEVAF